MNIRAENLSVKLDGKEILHNITIDFKRGISLLIGGNGSGKSTLLKTLAGIIPATSGRAFMGSSRVDMLPQREVARRCAILLQNPYAPPEMSVEEVVYAGRFVHGGNNAANREAVNQALADAGVEVLRRRKTGTLSGGERRKVFLARALAQESRILLLDEPDAALDAAARDSLRQTLYQLQKNRSLTIVMAVHELNFALDIASEICGIKAGNILFSGAAQDMITPENFQRLYDIPCRVSVNENGSGEVHICYSKLNS